MKFFIQFLTVTVLPLFVFSQGKTETQNLKHNDLDREFIIHLPDDYDSDDSLALVLNFHGYGSNANQQMTFSKFNDIADKEKFIVVYPQGTMLDDKTHWNVGGWTLASKVDDVDFVSNLIDHLVDTYNIDENRVYATGMSNGGYMSFLLACELGDKIAAIASVTGSMTPQTFKDCNPEHPTPVLQFHGDSDPTVPYEGNKMWTLSIDDVVNYWTNYNQTSTEASMQAMEDINAEDGSTVEKYSYNGGENGTAVIHYKVLNGQHDWFGARGNMDINSSEIIWEFFSNYDIDGKISD